MSVLDDIRAKYAKVEKVSDKYGRIISVRLLTASQRNDVRKWAGSNEPEVLAPMVFAAAVSAINDSPYTFPKTEVELKAVMDMLDDDGILSVAQAYQKLTGDVDTDAAAKNLAATENSEK